MTNHQIYNVVRAVCEAGGFQISRTFSDRRKHHHRVKFQPSGFWTHRGLLVGEKRQKLERALKDIQKRSNITLSIEPSRCYNPMCVYDAVILRTL